MRSAWAGASCSTPCREPSSKSAWGTVGKPSTNPRPLSTSVALISRRGVWPGDALVMRFVQWKWCSQKSASERPRVSKAERKPRTATALKFTSNWGRTPSRLSTPLAIPTGAPCWSSQVSTARTLGHIRLVAASGSSGAFTSDTEATYWAAATEPPLTELMAKMLSASGDFQLGVKAVCPSRGSTTSFGGSAIVSSTSPAKMAAREPPPEAATKMTGSFGGSFARRASAASYQSSAVRSSSPLALAGAASAASGSGCFT